MPDPILMLKAAAAAGGVAAIIALVCGLPWRASRPALASAGCVLGAAVGLAVGCWLLGTRPHWPPREDQDRLLLVVLPALLLIEVLAVFLRRPRLTWALRLVVAAAAARVLLHGTSYVTDLAGPGTREWTPSQTWLVLGALALILVGSWAALALLVRRPLLPAPTEIRWRDASVVVAVAIACGGAGITVMLSGYATGGQLGIPLAAAVGGAAIASLALKGRADVLGVLSFGLVGLFSLLVVGRFFGELTTSHALILFFAPLLCWLPELPYVRRLRGWLLAPARVLLTTVPVALVLVLAQQQFLRDSARTAPGSSVSEPSLEDYMNFGK